MSDLEDPRLVAKRCLDAITAARGIVAEQMKEIRKQQTKLVQVAVAMYDKESQALGHYGIDNRDALIGYRRCSASPILVCVYDARGRMMSLPGQREMSAWHASHPGKTMSAEQVMHASDATKTDACLFCGVRLDHDDHEHVNSRQIVEKPKRSR